MLAVAVRFLTGRYYAASHTDRSQPEWPPHPDRLFSALVASCHQACGGQGRAALEWLEQQGPPSLAVPLLSEAAQDGRMIPAMVRTNDAKPSNEGMKVLPSYRTPQPRAFPSIAVDVPIYFIWPNAEPDEDVSADLAVIASRMAYLGSSKSPVIAWMEKEPPAPVMVPAEESFSWETRVSLRVPIPGRLAELEEQFALGRRPLPGHQHPYRWLSSSTAIASTPPSPSAFGDMFLLARVSGPAPSPEATLTVTHALRRALLAVGDELSENTGEPGTGIPPLLHGHGPEGSPHCAFLMLPHVGARYADGHLLGVAIVFPDDAPAQEQSVVLQVLSKLTHIQTPLGRIDLAPVARQAPDAVPRGLTAERWCGPAHGATTWTSVTPVLFDRFPRPSRGGILGAVRTLARHVGLPAPLEASAHPMSPVSGVPLASAFQVHRADDDAPHYVAHVTVTFDQPVLGPVLLGAGRFFGLGLFVPYHATGE